MGWFMSGGQDQQNTGHDVTLSVSSLNVVADQFRSCM